MAQNDETTAGVVIINDSNGHSIVERDSTLKRLHYFDGKFLRAPDLQLEQDAILNRIRVSNQAGGSGIVHGLSCLLQGSDTLKLTPGLAFDPQGRLLQLGNEVDISISDLIARASSAAGDGCECENGDFGDCEKLTESGEADSVLESETLYLIVLHYVEAYCGEEDVYGKLCESACVSSTQRPYILPGIEVRAVPLTLNDLKQSPLITAKHLRSRVASAYFEVERQRVSAQISKTGLSSDIWCLGAEAAGGNGVALAIIGRAGGQTLFLDAWSARRERMESPPGHYWAYRLAMRPWHAFLAQLLQFQCQLRQCISKGGGVGEDDPCADERGTAARVAQELKQLLQRLEHSAEGIEEKAPQMMQMLPQLNIANIKDSYQQLVDMAKPSFSLPSRWLIDCGIVELPSGGYLPVDMESSVSVNDQVQRMMGEGVDLRFCVVRPDYIPHALEEARHMERICLLQGIDNPEAKPRVDVLVPEGQYEIYEPEVAGTGYEMEISGPRNDELADLPIKINIMNARAMYEGAADSKTMEGESKPSYVKRVLRSSAVDTARTHEPQAMQGAARGESLDSGGYAFYFAGRMPPLVRGLVRLAAEPMKIQVMSQPEAEAEAEADDAMAAEYLKEIELKYSRAKAREEGKIEEVVVEAADEKQRAGNYDMWLNLRCDRDPFTLSRGATCSVSLELALLAEMSTAKAQVVFILEATQLGSLVIEEVLQAPPEASLRARLSSNGTINSTLAMNGQRKQSGKSLRIDEQVYLKRAPGSQLGFSVSIPSLSFFNRWDSDRLDLDLGLHFERQWVSTGEAHFNASMNFSIEAGDAAEENEKSADGQNKLWGHQSAMHGYEAQQSYSQSKTVELLSGRQVINPDVMKPDHVLHDTSLVALGEIGKALLDDTYADSRSRLLFPPPLPMPEQLRVFARHDWVMFHRRRDIECGYSAPQQVASKPRRYRLLLVDSLNSAEGLREYVRALHANQGEVIQRIGYRDAGTVEFEAGLQTVLTSHGGLRSTWDNLVEGEQAVLMLGAIASRGAAYDEGATLARLRLQRISDVLSPVTPVDEEARLTLLNQVPDVLAEGERDGVIVMVVATPQATATVCHEVYSIQPDDVSIDRIKENIRKNGLEVLEKDYAGRRLQTEAQFKDGQAAVSNDSAERLKAEWIESGLGAPYRAMLVTGVDPATGDIPTDQPYQGQLGTVTKMVGGSDSQDLQTVVPLDQFSSGCIAVSILVVEPDYDKEKYATYAMITADAEPAAGEGAAEDVPIKNLTFNDQGKLEINESFKANIKVMKEEGVRVEGIDLVKADDSGADDAEKARAEELLKRLKKEGLAADNAEVNLRSASAREKTLIEGGNRKYVGGVVLRAVTAGHDPME